MTSIDTRHGRIAYVVSGPGEGPACVLIHGWTGSTREWSTRMSVEERMARRRRWAETAAEGYVCTLYGLLEKRDTSAELARLGRPMLIAHGDREEASIAAAARRLHAVVPGSRYAVVPDAEHFAQCDNPAALNRVLAGFLAEHGGV